jgi:pimeloyl-ACP methyl ester carboxylesterase
MNLGNLYTVSKNEKRGEQAAIDVGAPSTGAVDRFVQLDEGDMHVVENGTPGGPAVLLISNAAAPMAVWDPVIGSLAVGGFRIIRVDLLGSGKSTRPNGGYDIPTQARRVGDALDKLGVLKVTAIGHSSGCMLVTALAEQRPDAVGALALIDMGPSLDAKIPENPILRLLLAPLIGPLLWRLKTEATIRKGARTSFSRPVDIPDAFVEQTQGMTHRAFVGAMRGPLQYLGRRSLPDRLTDLRLPVLVVFGADDQRWRASSSAAYRVVPGARIEVLAGVGHTPMMEDPETTGKLLLDFARSVESLSTGAGRA